MEVQSAYFSTNKFNVPSSKKWLKSFGLNQIPDYKIENNYITYEFYDKSLFNGLKRKKKGDVIFIVGKMQKGNGMFSSDYGDSVGDMIMNPDLLPDGIKGGIGAAALPLLAYGAYRGVNAWRERNKKKE